MARVTELHIDLSTNKQKENVQPNATRMERVPPASPFYQYLLITYAFCFDFI